MATGTPEQAEAQFLSQYSSQGLIGCGSGAGHDLLFAPGTSADNIAAVTAAASSFDWTGNSTYIPDVNGWETAIWADTSIDPGSKLEGVIFYPLIEKNSPVNPQYVMQAWAEMVASSPPWLTTAFQNSLLHYAALYNVALTQGTYQGIDPTVAS